MYVCEAPLQGEKAEALDNTLFATDASVAKGLSEELFWEYKVYICAYNCLGKTPQRY